MQIRHCPDRQIARPGGAGRCIEGHGRRVLIGPRHSLESDALRERILLLLKLPLHCVKRRRILRTVLQSRKAVAEILQRGSNLV